MDFDSSCLDNLNIAYIDVNAVDVSDFDFDTIANAYAQPNEDTICDCSSLICVHHYNRQHQVKELKRFYNCLVRRGESVEFKDEFFPGFRCIQSYGRDYHEIIYMECNNRTQYGENTTRFVDTKKRSPELFILFHNGRYFQCRGNMVQCYSLTNKLGGPWVVPGENPEDERALQPHGVNMPRDADENFEPPEYRATWLFKDIRWRGLLMQSEEAFYSVVGCDARDGVATFTFEPVHRVHPGSRQAYVDQEEVKWYFVAKKMTGIRVLFADNITPHSLIFEVQGEVRARGRSDAFLSRARDFLEPLRMGAAKAQHFFEACVGPGLWEDTCVLWLPRFRFNPKQCFYDIDFAGLYILRHWKNHGTYVGRRLDNQLCLLNEAFETLKDPARYSIRGMVTLKDLLLAPMMSEVIEHMKTFQTDGRLLEALLFVRELVSKFNIHEPDSIRLNFYFLIHKKYCRSLKLADLNLIRMCVVHPPVTPHYVVGDSKLRTEKIMGDVRRLTTGQVTGDFPDGSTLKGVYANAPAHVRPITPHARRVSGLLQPQDVTWAVQGAAVRLAEAGSSVTESTTADSYYVANALGESEGTPTCGAPDAATGNSGAPPGDRSGPSRVTDGGDDNTVDEGGTRSNAVDATDGDNRGTSVARSVDCGEDRSKACVTRDKSAIENDGYEERGEACALRNELVLETDGKEKNSEAWETRDKCAVETDGGKERDEACVTRDKRALETVGDEESGEACALRDELALETDGSEENGEACEARDKSALKTDVGEESGEACVTRDKPAVETDGAEDRGEVCVSREKSAVETDGGEESSKVCVTRDKPAVETDGDEDRSEACVTRDKPAVETDGDEDRSEACVTRDELAVETDGGKDGGEACLTCDKTALKTSGSKEKGDACALRIKPPLETDGGEDGGEKCAPRDEPELETDCGDDRNQHCATRMKPSQETHGGGNSTEECETRDKSASANTSHGICPEEREAHCDKPEMNIYYGEDNTVVCTTRCGRPALEKACGEDNTDVLYQAHCNTYCVHTDSEANNTGTSHMPRNTRTVHTDYGNEHAAESTLRHDTRAHSDRACAHKRSSLALHARCHPHTVDTDCSDYHRETDEARCAAHKEEGLGLGLGLGEHAGDHSRTPDVDTHLVRALVGAPSGGHNRAEQRAFGRTYVYEKSIDKCTTARGEACVADKVDNDNTSRAAAGAAVPPSASYDASARTLHMSHTRGSPVSAFCTDEASRAPASPSRASTAQPARSASPSLKAASQQCRSPHHVSDDHAVFPASPSQQAASPQQRSPNEVFPLVVPTPEAAHRPQELTNETDTSCPHSNALETDAHLKSATVAHAASSSWRSHWWSQEPSSKWTREQAPRTKWAKRRWWHEDDIWLGESGDGWSTTSWCCRAWDKENTEVASHTSWARSAWDKENTEGASHTSWARSAWSEKGTDAAAHKPWAWSTWDKESAQAAAAAEKKPWCREARAWGNKHDARGAWSSTAPRRSRQ